MRENNERTHYPEIGRENRDVYIGNTILTHLFTRRDERRDIAVHGVSAGRENTADPFSNGHLIIAVGPLRPQYEPEHLETLIHDIFSYSQFPTMQIERPHITDKSLKSGRATFTQTGTVVHVPEYSISSPDMTLLGEAGFSDVSIFPSLPEPKVVTQNQQIVTVLFYPNDAMASWVGRNYQKRSAMKPSPLSRTFGMVMRGKIPLHVLHQYQQGNYFPDIETT